MTDNSISLAQEIAGFFRFGGARVVLLEIEAGFWGIRRQVEALIGARLTNMVLQQAGANGGASFAGNLFSGKETDPIAAFNTCLQAYQMAGFGAFEITHLEMPVGRICIRGQDTFEAWMMRRHNYQFEQPVCAYTAGVLVGFINAISRRFDIVCIEHACQAQGAAACEFELLPASQAGTIPAVAMTPDPGLGRQLNLLETLFERTPMGIAIFDKDLNLVRCNPTWAEHIARYTPTPIQRVIPGANLFDLAPGTEETVAPILQRVLAGETIHTEALRTRSGEMTSYWDAVFSPLIEEGEIAGILDVAIDVTERMQIYQELESRVEERTRELDRRRQIAESMRDIIRMINSNIPLDTFLDQAVRLAAQRIGASACVLHHFDLENQTISHLASYGMEGIFRKGGVRNLSLLKPSGGNDYFQATLRRQPTYQNYPPMPQRVEDIRNDPSIPEEIKAERIALRSKYAGSLSVPLFIQENVYGGMVFYYTEPQEFSEEQIQLGMTFADQVALAIENARLSAQVRQSAIEAERNRLARDLHDAVTQTLFSASLVAEVLPKLWERNPEEGRRRLEELRLLTRGALSEMRTLLLELRPSALEETDIRDLFRHLFNAFTGRSRIPVEFNQQGDVSPEPEVKEVFYRVAQETMNNITKHAAAHHVWVDLSTGADQVSMIIRDDGSGFEPQAVKAGHLGLGIMQERAQQIGARLEIISTAGSGTQVKLTWSKYRKEKNP